MQQPHLRHIVNLWSLVHFPTEQTEWSLKKKLEAVKEAGFDGITTSVIAEHQTLCKKLGLYTVGFISVSVPAKFNDVLKSQKQWGAHHVNVQLADEDTPVEVSTGMALKIIELGRSLGLDPAIEVHRDTCTETPEKTYAIADGYQKITGELLPITWDFSHLAVVKHISTPYAKRLLTRPDLIQRAQQLHLRPFNGHHCQVPVSDGKGGLSPEVQDWLAFVEELFVMWLQGDQAGREIFLVPEMGPVAGGYNLSSLPNSWEDAKLLRVELDKIWKKALAKSKFA
jgi:hypothetical protein